MSLPFDKQLYSETARYTGAADRNCESVTFEAPGRIGYAESQSANSVLSQEGCAMECTGLSLFRRSHLGLDRGSDAGGRANLVARKSRTIAIPLAAALLFVVQMAAARVPRADAASGLKLSPNLSFDDDSSPNYPIQGDDLSEGSIASGEATVIFFGTSNCWNTSREAERLVKLYPQFRNRIHFVIVDLNNVATEQQTLVSQYYHGYIPTITAIDSKGNVIYDRAGETASTRGDTSNLQRLLDSVH
jgi:hypothetical protein